MTPSRRVLPRAASLFALTLLLAACGGAAATASAGAPAATTPSAAVSANVAASVVPSAAANGGVPDCGGLQAGHVAFKMFGLEAQHYCGPATATVTLAGTTVSIASGWCETNAAGYSVAIGTQLFGNPSASQEPDLLLVLVDPTTGAGPISGVVNHRHWLLSGGPLHFGAGKLSGTFSGTAIVGGAVSGSFTCG